MEQIPYRLIRSGRKTVAIQINPDGSVIVRAPRRMGTGDIARFVESKRGWIETHLAKQSVVMPKWTDGQLEELVLQAKREIPQRVAYFAEIAGVTYGKITIRKQRTRWGSCSGRGNLSFNCLLMQMPAEVLDYVVVHELCHRKEMNHSPRFWAEVEKILPQYKNSRRWLKENGPALLARLPSVAE